MDLTRYEKSSANSVSIINESELDTNEKILGSIKRFLKPANGATGGKQLCDSAICLQWMKAKAICWLK